MDDPTGPWRMYRRRVLWLAVLVLPLVFLGSSARAQSIMRTPNFNIGSRIPNINPHLPRAAIAIGRMTPNFRTYSGCGTAYRARSGECLNRPVLSMGDGGRASPPGKNINGGRRRIVQQAILPSRVVAGEIVAEIDGLLSDRQADALARRHGLARLDSRNFPLLNATIGLFRVTGRRTAETVSRDLAVDANVRAVQPNFRYALQDQNTALTEGDPAQYALAKLRLPQAHTLVHGANVTIAVIDSGIDAKHPELAKSIADSFDALGGKDGPHVHGTGIAGVIVSHARLMGSAPEARILAIRAFGAGLSGAESTSYVILKSLDYAALHGAQIVNMSFAGPRDAIVERAIAAIAARGIVLVGASGNAGPKSPPLYPAANPNVIAVSATDAQDRLFAPSNRGSHIALCAPGADIFLPAPGERYQMTSGTSFSAAYVSGIAALLLERNPALKPQEVRALLTRTARDLGSPGRDDLFGAGEADAFAAVSALGVTPPSSIDTNAGRLSGKQLQADQESPAARALNEAAPATASEKSGSDELRGRSGER